MTKKAWAVICICIVFLTLIVAVAAWTAWGNTALELNTYVIESEKIGKSFDGFKIGQVTDLHNDELGEDNCNLISTLALSQPDIIVITGDLIDSRTPNVEVSLSFCEKAAKIAPCYFVSGNHEQRVPLEYRKLISGLKEIGVVLLDNTAIKLRRGEDSITLAGAEDPSFQTTQTGFSAKTVMNNLLSSLLKEDEYTVLLSHRPELFEVYAQHKVDVVLCGHAHGGQFRLPFLGGLYAPDQGVLPKYDAGRYEDLDTTMLVSRGVGNSLFPFRFNNRPEVLLVELSVKD